MMVEPDWTQAIAETFTLPENADWWPLPVGGYLLAVSLRAHGDLPQGTDVNFRAEYEITEPNGAALHERIQWQYQLPACGCAFAEPLPNMNSASPYTLTRVQPQETPPLSVTVVHLNIKDSRT